VCASGHIGRDAMIQSFLASWDLFQNTYLAGWGMGLVLAQVGVIVVARDQIFIGAGVSQASALGVAAALWIGQMASQDPNHWFRSDAFLAVMAVIFSVAAAWMTTIRRNADRESHEAVTGWVFLLSASLSILLLSRSPHGLEEIQRLVSSSIIGATGGDVLLFLVMATLSGLLLVFIHRPLLLLAMDRPMAEALGMRTGLWSASICIWLGLSLGLSIRCAGTLYAFGCLVLPPLISQGLCREVSHMFLVAPLVFLAAAVPGFVLANHLDFPPAQMTVALLCGGFALIWVKARLRQPFA